MQKESKKMPSTHFTQNFISEIDCIFIMKIVEWTKKNISFIEKLLVFY
jgi:hypothetical protein